MFDLINVKSKVHICYLIIISCNWVGILALSKIVIKSVSFCISCQVIIHSFKDISSISVAGVGGSTLSERNVWQVHFELPQGGVFKAVVVDLIVYHS